MEKITKEQEILQKGNDEQYNEFVKYVRSLSTTDLVEYLEPKHRSDVYIVIRDIITPLQVKNLKSDIATRARFKKISEEAKQSWDHDNAMAMNKDVDRACTVVYNTVLKLMRGLMDDMIAKNEQIYCAINRIEEKLGMDKTDFYADPADEIKENVSVDEDMPVGQPIEE